MDLDLLNHGFDGLSWLSDEGNWVNKDDQKFSCFVKDHIGYLHIIPYFFLHWVWL
tara:strand:+ start:82 stop:246 length:165 start_codon:yes stop_codon:yes gene_type:complete